MKLSILIPLYNKEKYIERCLKSLLDQDVSLDEYEIVIVDDGSKDSGKEIVQKFMENHGTHVCNNREKRSYTWEWKLT